MPILRDVKIRERDDLGGRVPPAQVVTKAWPVLHSGSVPTVDLEHWRFKVDGLVDEPRSFTWDEFSALPIEPRKNDIHCVTHWSKLDNEWEGIPVRRVLSLVKPKPEAKFVLQRAVGGWTTNLPVEDFDREENLFALRHSGEPLSKEHGWPCRVVVPHLYFWKGAKWVNGLTFLAVDQAGFWERSGYHMRGDPWKEERFR